MFALQVVCIDLCCPHGEAYLANPHYDYTDYTQPAITCQQEDQAGTFRPEVKDNQTEEVVEWEESRHYLLRARAGGFQCPPQFAAEFSTHSLSEIRSEELLGQLSSLMP